MLHFHVYHNKKYNKWQEMCVSHLSCVSHKPMSFQCSSTASTAYLLDVYVCIYWYGIALPKHECDAAASATTM